MVGKLRFKQGRGSIGVAAVEIDYRRIGWVRKFGPNDWRAKLDGPTDYPETGYPTRQEAGEALLAESGRA